MVKYGLLTYRTENIGDEIQSIAARQFLPRVDVYVERDSLNNVVSDEKIKLIMNGWFTHKPENWPPSPDIEPLFISFHITPSAAHQLTSPQSIKYFKQHEPIGCRDYYTVNLLKKKGVDAYFSGCLTLTLQNTIKKRSNEILLVDIDLEDKDIIEYLPRQLIQEASFITRSSVSPNVKKMRELLQYKYRMLYHIIRRIHVNYAALRFLAFLAKMRCGEKKLQEAEELLKRYMQAKLVITSRLHGALPCLAFGTPVIFVRKDLNDPRFKGYIEYLQAYSLDEFKQKCYEIKWDSKFKNPNSGKLEYLKKDMIRRVKAFVKDEPIQ